MPFAPSILFALARPPSLQTLRDQAIAWRTQFHAVHVGFVYGDPDSYCGRVVLEQVWERRHEVPLGKYPAGYILKRPADLVPGWENRVSECRPREGGYDRDAIAAHGLGAPPIFQDPSRDTCVELLWYLVRGERYRGTPREAWHELGGELVGVRL